MTDQNERFIPSLDGLRAVSVALVVAAHLLYSGTAPEPLTGVLRYMDGAAGVRFFFVISGFLITSLLLAEQAKGKASLGRFYMRRFIRLFPVQFTFIAVLGALTLTTGLQMSGCQFVTALTYTKNYACRGWIDGHLWSLAVEEQFYLFWPLLLLRLPRRIAVAGALALIVISPASRALEYTLGARNTFFWLSSNSDALMIGCLLAFLKPETRSAVARWRPAIGRVLAAIALIVPTILANHLMLGALTVTVGPTAQALAAAYLICSLTAAPTGISYYVLNLKGVRFVGVLSYSIYVWQQIFFSRPDTFGLAEAPWPLRFPFNIILVAVTAVASYLLIEKPFLRLRYRLKSGSGLADPKLP